MPRFAVHALLAVCAFWTAAAACYPMSVTLDGKPVAASVRVVKGTALAPYRPILEAAGVTCKWVPETKAVSARSDQHTLYVAIGEQTALLDGKIVVLPVPGQMIEGVAYLPLRALIEAFGLRGKYDSARDVFEISTGLPPAVEQPELPLVTVTPTTPVAPAPAPVPEAAAGPAEARPIPSEAVPALPSTPPGPMAPIYVAEHEGRRSAALRPVIVGGRALIPLRSVSESLGINVKWQGGPARIISLESGRHIAHLQVGSDRAAFDDSAVTLDAPVTLVAGSAHVPARFLAQLVGGTAKWDPLSRMVTISCPPAIYSRVTIGEIVAHPKDFEGKLVTVWGTYAGRDPLPDATATEGGHPVAAEDGIIKDDSGAVYFTGEMERRLDPQSEVGTPLLVSGLVRLSEKGLPYVELGFNP